MPEPSDKTAWDFLPEDWSTEELGTTENRKPEAATGKVVFQQGAGSWRQVTFPADFQPITQLESARLGIITSEMERVAERACSSCS